MILGAAAVNAGTVMIIILVAVLAVVGIVVLNFFGLWLRALLSGAMLAGRIVVIRVYRLNHRFFDFGQKWIG